MYPTKVLGEDGASTDEPNGHSEKVAPLLEYLIVESAFLLIVFGPWRTAPTLKGASGQGIAPGLVSGRRTYWRRFSW